MARAASALDISTKPNPRGRPVSPSLMRASVSTVPWGAKSARTDSSVAVKGKLPTNSLVTADFSQYRIEHRQEVPASWIDDAFRSGGVLGGRGHGGGAKSKGLTERIGHEPASRLQEFPTACTFSSF